MRIAPPNSLITAQFTQNIADLRKSIARTSEEAVTGQIADLAGHLSGRVGTAMLSQKALDDISLQREQISLREGRLDVTQRSLTAIHNRVQGLDTEMRAALGVNDLRSQGLIARDAQAALTDVFGALNVRFGERHLFSGDATATAPLPDPGALIDDIRQLADSAATPADFQTALSTYFNDPAGGWAQSIYGGTPTSSDPEAATANDPAIVQLITGLAVLAISDPADSPVLISQNPDIVLSGVQLLSTGTDSLTNLRAEKGVFQEQIATLKETLDVEETIFTNALGALTARDQYEAASALKQLEATLEASYLLTTRLASLSLLNYMR